MRSELVDRCVDGALYGSLPRCQDCGGGVLRVRYPSKYGHGGQGAFHCPGYYDGDAFIHCAFSASTVARPKWLETCARQHDLTCPLCKQPMPHASAPVAASSAEALSPMATHLVRPGETLASIALRYGVRENSMLMRENSMLTPAVAAGQRLRIPDAAPVAADTAASVVTSAASSPPETIAASEVPVSTAAAAGVLQGVELTELTPAIEAAHLT